MSNSIENLLITLSWVLLCAIPSALLLGFEVEMRASSGVRCGEEISFLLWVGLIVLTASRYAAMLGRFDEVEAPAEPEPEPALGYLPPQCATFLQEARSIRADIGATKAALERAWLLTQELERASPDVREFLHQCGASLDGVHTLLELCTRGRRRPISIAHLRERLDAELAAFERALVDPRIGYR
jgi:hypothetical protein